MDHLRSNNLEERRKKGGCSSIKDQIAGLGATSNGSNAPMASSGLLNPVFASWLMGFPAAWLKSLDSETR
jgi:hypothetical protein